MSEQDTVNAILEYLHYVGHYCWRNNTGAFKKQSGGFYRYGKVGSSDILGVHRTNGKMIAIEVKQKGNKPTAFQLDFLTAIQERGGIAGVVHDIDEVKELLNIK